MNSTAVAGIALLAFAAYTLWPQIKGALSKLGRLLPSLPDISAPEDPQLEEDLVDFRAYRRLVDRAARCSNPDGMKYLQAAMTPLFGGSDGPATPPNGF